MQHQQGDVAQIAGAVEQAEGAVRHTLQGLSNATASTSTALNKQAQAELSTFRGLLRDLELLVEEEDSARLQQRLSAQLAGYKQVYEQLQTDFKAQNVQVLQRAAKNAAAERKALLGGRSPADKQTKLQSDEDALNATQDITAGLQRTRQMLIQELDHTSTALAAMEASHTTLAATSDQYSVQKGAFSRSRLLLNTMRLHNMLDWLLLWGGVAFFALVVLYILQKRLLYFVPNVLKPSFLKSGPRPPSGPLPGSPSPPPPLFAPVDWEAATSSPAPAPHAQPASPGQADAFSGAWPDPPSPPVQPPVSPHMASTVPPSPDPAPQQQQFDQAWAQATEPGSDALRPDPPSQPATANPVQPPSATLQEQSGNSNGTAPVPDATALPDSNASSAVEVPGNGEASPDSPSEPGPADSMQASLQGPANASELEQSATNETHGHAPDAPPETSDADAHVKTPELGSSAEEQGQGATESGSTEDAPVAADAVSDVQADAAAVPPEPVLQDSTLGGSLAGTRSEATDDLASSPVTAAAEVLAEQSPSPPQRDDSNTSSSSSTVDSMEAADHDADASSHERSYGTWPESAPQDDTVDLGDGSGDPENGTVRGQKASTDNASKDHEQHVQLLSSTHEQLPLPTFPESLSPEQMHQAWATDRSMHPSLEDAAAQVEVQGGESLLASDPADNVSSSQSYSLHDEL